MKQLVAISALGLVGILLRYGIGVWASRWGPGDFPWATLTINVAGAFLIGVVHVAGLERSAIPVELRLGLTVGLLGGFTTFSAYCIEALRLWEGGARLLASLYLAGSPLLGVLACYAGVALTRLLD